MVYLDRKERLETRVFLAYLGNLEPQALKVHQVCQALKAKLDRSEEQAILEVKVPKEMMGNQVFPGQWYSSKSNC
jgi:hypothetical protein